MDVNILSPKSAVANAFKEPSVSQALFLVVLAWIIPIIAQAIQGFGISISSEIFQLIFSAARLFLGAAIIYAAAYLLKAEKAKGKFNAIVSAWSLVWVVSLAAAIIVFLLLPLAFAPSVVDPVKKFSNREISIETLSASLSAALDSADSPVNFPVLAVLGILGLALFALAFSIVYRIFKEILGFRPIPVLATEIAALFAFFLITGFLGI